MSPVSAVVEYVVRINVLSTQLKVKRTATWQPAEVNRGVQVVGQINKQGSTFQCRSHPCNFRDHAHEGSTISWRTKIGQSHGKALGILCPRVDRESDLRHVVESLVCRAYMSLMVVIQSNHHSMHSP